MRSSKTLFAGILVAGCVSPALAQTNVGQLLDSGAVKLSAADFKQQIVDRLLEGPGRGTGFTTFSAQEVVYLENGVIRGSGQVTTPGGMSTGGASSSKVPRPPTTATESARQHRPRACPSH